MNDVAFFSTDDLLCIHARMIQEFGGSPGLRDRGLLESACAMPSASFGGQLLHDGLPAMAAAYLFHLCKNHPFVDGNKRVAFGAMEVFLMLNGHEVVGESMAIHRRFIKLFEAGKFRLAELENYLRAKIMPLQGRA